MHQPRATKYTQISRLMLPARAGLSARLQHSCCRGLSTCIEKKPLQQKQAPRLPYDRTGPSHTQIMRRDILLTFSGCLGAARSPLDHARHRNVPPFRGQKIRQLCRLLRGSKTGPRSAGKSDPGTMACRLPNAVEGVVPGPLGSPRQRVAQLIPPVGLVVQNTPRKKFYSHRWEQFFHRVKLRRKNY